LTAIVATGNKQQRNARLGVGGFIDIDEVFPDGLVYFFVGAPSLACHRESSNRNAADNGCANGVPFIGRVWFLDVAVEGGVARDARNGKNYKATK